MKQTSLSKSSLLQFSITCIYPESEASAGHSFAEPLSVLHQLLQQGGAPHQQLKSLQHKTRKQCIRNNTQATYVPGNDLAIT